jgi:hypothetical protein
VALPRNFTKTGRPLDVSGQVIVRALMACFQQSATVRVDAPKDGQLSDVFHLRRNILRALV